MPQKVPIQMPQLGESIAEATIVTLHIAAGDSIRPIRRSWRSKPTRPPWPSPPPVAATVAEISAATRSVLRRRRRSRLPRGHRRRGPQRRHRFQPTSRATPLPPSSRHPPFPPTPTSKITVPPPSRSPRQSPAPPASSPPSADSRFRPTRPAPPTSHRACRARMNELGINAADLAGVAGSGAGGRVTVEDFERFMQSLEEQRKCTGLTHAHRCRRLDAPLVVAPTRHRRIPRPPR